MAPEQEDTGSPGLMGHFPSPAPLTVGMVMFPNLTQLDLTGP